MSARPQDWRDGKTKLARARIWHDKTQRQMAEAIGISLPVYQQLERGEKENPPLRYLVNAQLALGLERLEDVLEPEWLEWWTNRGIVPAAPDPERFLPRWPGQPPRPRSRRSVGQGRSADYANEGRE